jgi:hypothetical protein
VTATQVTFDADEDDLTESDPDDETTTLFQSALHADTDSEGTDSDTQDTDRDFGIAEEDKEYFTEIIDGVRYLQYRVIVRTEFPPPTMPQDNLGNSENANKPVQASSSIDNTMNTSSSNDTYEWGRATTEPTWGTWRTRPNITPLALEGSTWGEVTKDWEGKERDTVITRGRSPPPKLRSEPNLFQDGHTQGIPIRDPHASDDLAFKTGRKAARTIQPKISRSIPTHPNPFEPLSEPLAPYTNFVPETDTEDDDDTTNNTQAQPKPPKRQKRHRTRVRYFQDEDITEEEKDLSMYSLSDEDSDSSLTIHYKAYDNNKPKMNESSAESRCRTKAMEKDIARFKAQRSMKKQRKKRPQGPGAPTPYHPKKDPDEDPHPDRYPQPTHNK